MFKDKGREVYWVWDGQQLALEFNFTGTLTYRFLYGPGVDQVLSQDNGSGGHWFLPDHLGTTRDLVDEDGDHVMHNEFDAYGRLLNIPAFSTLLLFAGREYDTTLKMYYVRARWYDPEVGRWASEDPIGLGPDTNLYRYVANSPVNYTDPSGLEGEEDGGAQKPGQNAGVAPPAGRPIPTVNLPNDKRRWPEIIKGLDKKGLLDGYKGFVGCAKIEPGRIPSQGAGVPSRSHQVFDKSKMKDGQYCGSGAAGPCVGLIIVGPKSNDSILVFHFGLEDDPARTIQKNSKHIPKGSKAIVFGGDNCDASNSALSSTLSGLILMYQKVTVDYANWEGLWVDKDGKFYVTTKTPRPKDNEE